MIRTLREDLTFVCGCGCNRSYPVLFRRVESGESFSNVLAMLVSNETERRVWLAVGSGAWKREPGGPPDAFAVVETWLGDGQFISRVGDLAESPWATFALFKDPTKVAVMSRAEVLSHEGGSAWLFGVVDEMTEGEPRIRSHLGR